MMTSNNFPAVKGFLRTALAGVLAASTLAFAQETAAPTAPNTNGDTQQQSSSPSGGWKRVGDQSQVYNANVNNDGDYQNGDSNQPAGSSQPSYPAQQPPNVNQQPYPNQQPQYPANGGGQYGQQGYPAQSGYPPTNGQSGYPNNQQQNYPPPAPVPAQLTIPVGTYLTVRINQMLSSDKNQPGDAFTGSLMQPVVVNGVVVAEPGQTLGGRVVTAERHHSDRPARLGLALTNLSLVDGQQIPVSTQFISRQGGTTPTGAEVGTVAATTGVGAAIGAIAGWGTGAAIGAGAGAAAGLIGVLITHNHASVVYPEQVLTFKLESPVTISTVNSSQAFRYVQPNEYDRPTYSNYSGNRMYESAAPAPPAYSAYGYGYPYYGAYGWGYPYWGPSFAFFGGGYYWGGRWYPRGGYYGGRGYYGGGYYAARGYAGGGFHGAVGGRR